MMLQPIWPVVAAAGVLLLATVVWSGRSWSSQSRGDRTRSVVRVLLATVALVIGLHPVGELHVREPLEKRADVVIVLDRTTSMGARDWAGERPRMEGVATDLTQLVQQVAGARTAVVVFDDDARLAVPFTTDATALTSFWETVGWRPSAKAAGSDISVANDLTEQVLRLSAEERPDHERYVVYVGDGEQTAPSAPGSFGASAELVDGALVLGYGTRSGGWMSVADDSVERIRVDGEVQVSRIDEAALRRIATELGGDYLHRVRSDDLPELVTATAAEPDTVTVRGQEYYWILAIPAVAGLLWLLWVAVGGLRAAREEVSRDGGS